MTLPLLSTTSDREGTFSALRAYTKTKNLSFMTTKQLSPAALSRVHYEHIEHCRHCKEAVCENEQREIFPGLYE